MNPFNSWLSLVLWFLAPFAIAAFIGLVCYKVAHWLGENLPEVLVILELLIACGATAFLLASFPYSLPGVGVLLVVCGVGALAERAISPRDQLWGAVFAKMLFTIICSIMLSPLLCADLRSYLYRQLGAGSGRGEVETAFTWGILVGAIGAPAVLPVFIWLWRSSQMRPGVDRHLNAEERALGE